MHRRNLPWELHVIENNSWNAFTIGGGKIFVYTGIFSGKAAITSDDELAAILAHEMAHITARHASESQGKMMISKLVDKNLRSNVYQASFTTIQENEADKYSVIYSALAGYNPAAGATIWQKMDKIYGSNATNILYDHPLNKNRAKNLVHYANLAKQYYIPNQVNKNHQALLKNNAVFSYAESTTTAPGKGAGFKALLETLGNAYIETEKAKSEQRQRQIQ